MKIAVQEPSAGSRAILVLGLDDTDLAALEGGDPLPFAFRWAGGTSRAELLITGGKPTDAKLDHRLWVALGAVRAARHGRVRPLFEDLPFGVQLEHVHQPARPGPIQLGGVTFHPIDTRSRPPAQLSTAYASAASTARPPNPIALILSGLVIIGVGFIGLDSRDHCGLGALILLGGAATAVWGLRQMLAGRR